MRSILNPLTYKIERELEQACIHDAELLRERYDDKEFGNALAVYRVGNLFLNFVRERGDDTVDFLNPTDQSQLYTFSDMSLVMGWITLDELIRKYKRTNFDEPPCGPIPLDDALGLILRDFDQLQQMFSSSDIPDTLEKLKDASKKRCKAFFG